MVLNHHHRQCLQNVVSKTKKIMRFACGMHRWYICYLVFIIVGTYYINILVNVVLVLSTAIVMDGQGYKTIQSSFVNKYINKVILVV